jgi:hypothetical protein
MNKPTAGNAASQIMAALKYSEQPFIYVRVLARFRANVKLKERCFIPRDFPVMIFHPGIIHGKNPSPAISGP